RATVSQSAWRAGSRAHDPDRARHAVLPAARSRLSHGSVRIACLVLRGSALFRARGSAPIGHLTRGTIRARAQKERAPRRHRASIENTGLALSCDTGTFSGVG